MKQRLREKREQRQHKRRNADEICLEMAKAYIRSRSYEGKTVKKIKLELADIAADHKGDGLTGVGLWAKVRERLPQK